MGQLIVQEVGKDVHLRETWDQLLTHWSKALNQYFDSERDDDLPHWHNERAQVGFLAAAVWKMEGIALEEYRTPRAELLTRENREKRTQGRCDLYFSVGELSCIVESKLVWLTADTEVDKVQIEKQLKTAKKQLDSLERKERKHCTGMSLCWGVATRSDKRAGEAAKLSRFARELASPDRILGVYHLPFRTRAKAEHKYGDKGESYPGVVLVGQTHKWAR